ncbi:hypothetical protein GX48_07988 [Paracoccidioides brasiliensis]|nr:hypothetical protein GX48_07988 [Paracoccidioides brasiliensis]
MRVFWVPHPDVAVECKTRKKDMLTGRTLMIKVADNWQLDQPDDGWVESIPNLNIPITRVAPRTPCLIFHHATISAYVGVPRGVIARHALIWSIEEQKAHTNAIYLMFKSPYCVSQDWPPKRI